MEPGEKIFQGEYMVWLEVLVVGQLLFALLFLNSGFVCSYFTLFFFFFLSQEHAVMPECEICGDQGARHLEVHGGAGSQNVVVRKLHLGK